MGKYAATTSVPVSNSKQEIERLLARYKADQTLFFHEQDYSVLQFRMRGRTLKFEVVVPPVKDFHKDDKGYVRSEAGSLAAYTQEGRRRWRVLVLLLKAKLEVVDDEAVDFDSEFLANLVTSSGETVGEKLVPIINQTLSDSSIKNLLTG